MKGIKKWFVMVMVVALCLQTAITGSVEAANTDITLVSCDVDMNLINQNDVFSLDSFTYRNNTAGAIDDIYLIIDPGCDFYGPIANAYKLNDITTGNTNGTVTDDTVRLVYKGKGNTLIYKFSYKIDSTYYETTPQTIFINEAVPADNTPSTPVNTLKYIPQLGVAGFATQEVKAGKTLSLKIPVKNSSTHMARNISLALEFEDKAKAPLIINQVGISQSIDQIPSNETKEITFPLAILKTAPGGTYAVKLNYTFTNAFNDPFTSSQTVYIKIEGDSSMPVLSISGFEVDAGAIEAGRPFDMKLNIKNLGSLAAKNVSITLGGLKSDGVSVSGSSDTRYVAQINGKGTGMATYSLTASGGVLGSSYPLAVNLQYGDEVGNTYKETQQIFLSLGGNAAGAPTLAFENIQSPKGAVQGENDFVIGFDLANRCEGRVDNIKAWITTDSQIIPKSVNTVQVGSLAKGEAKSLKFTLSAIAEAAAKNYPIALNVEYDVWQGDRTARQTAVQYVGVYVGNAGEKSIPRIIVDKYGCEPGEVKAGQEFALNLSFLNTSAATQTGNIKVSVSSEDGTFVPVNNSNTFFIREIAPGSREEKSLNLRSKPDAEQKSYSVTIAVEYEDGKGNPYTSKETVSIPVVQPPRLVMGEISTVPQAPVGESVPLSAEFYNLGKSTLYNLAIRLEGDFQTPSKNFFVGNFEPGRSDYFDGTIQPKSPGKLTGSLVFSFEDASGKASEIRKEFAIEIIEMRQAPSVNAKGMIIEPDGRVIQVKKGNSFSLIPVVSIGILLAAGVLVFIVLRRKRARRKEMMLDE